MPATRHYLGGLVALHEVTDAEQRLSIWRQSMATLGDATADSRALPLEGLGSTRSLVQSVRHALDAGLVDDLGFLDGPAAACATYALATALPMGAERREMGRRVLMRLNEGDAASFVALATCLARGGSRALDGTGARARVALSLVLPMGAGSRVDGLALALLSRPELASQWLERPSQGSLAARRMAARLLERAAREAVQRALQGDDGAVRVLMSEHVVKSFRRLLEDREPLVWRHVATARGMLAVRVSLLREAVEQDLAPDAHSSRLRRGAASLAAGLAFEPQRVIERIGNLLQGPQLERDRGIAAALIYGLPRAAESEPEAAERVLHMLVRQGGLLAAEALVELRREWGQQQFGQAAAQVARVELRQNFDPVGQDDGQVALIDHLCESLGEQGTGARVTLSGHIAMSMSAFCDQGPRFAHDAACLALEAVRRAVDELEHLDMAVGGDRQRAFGLLMELDVALLESSALADLLSLMVAGNEAGTHLDELHRLRVRLTEQLLSTEQQPYVGGEEVAHLTLRMRRLRLVLHLLDDEGWGNDDRSPQRAERVTWVAQLFMRIQRDAPSSMDRIVHAAVARACDGLVRDRVLELSDVILATCQFVPTPEGFAALAEGSMLTHLKRCLRPLAALARTLHANRGDSQSELTRELMELSEAMPSEGSPRTEVLRSALLRVGRVLQTIASARSLTAITRDADLFARLERGIDELVQLSHGVRRRLGGEVPEAPPTSGLGARTLDRAVEQRVKGADPGSLTLSIETLSDSLRAELPTALAETIAFGLQPLDKLPNKPARSSGAELLVVPDEGPLPAWLPPSRVLGGFYVLRMLGEGSLGSVFVVKRMEERHDPMSEELALKVPEYDGSAARSLSQEEFMGMFRHEAGALLAVPSHANLASFVTFDAGVRPKPVLVMELVPGLTLEHVIERGEFSCARALDIVDQVLAGLESMHSVGVGHLDVKPSNIILRPLADGQRQPVLVDFGLAGRHVRPGCATGSYGAPEIWGAMGTDALLQPMPCDVYALGCVAYELFTGRLLFEAPNEALLIRRHLEHDGVPAEIVNLGSQPGLEGLATWLTGCLRQDPTRRFSASEARQQLRMLVPDLGQRGWPLSCSQATAPPVRATPAE